jgi:GNAT superfamily N-acetyltransferase
MPRFSVASEQQTEAIYRESHTLWGAGLSAEDYLGLWRDVSRTAWARKHARFFVWLDDEGEVLSSMKVYRPRVRLHDSVSRLCVLGAIFTPAELRRRGHATAMVRHALRQERHEGSRMALLFSDIGTSFYESLGFRPLPAEEQWSWLWRTRRQVPTGWSLRAMREDDAPLIRRAHAEFVATRPLAVERDEEHWEFLAVRSASFFSRLRDPRVAQFCRVALHRGEFVGYLLSVEGHGEWNVREVGSVGADPMRMADVMRLGAASARRCGLTRFYGWLPPETLSYLSEWRIEARVRRRAVPMILPLDVTVDPASLGTPQAAYIPYQDQF